MGRPHFGIALLASACLLATACSADPPARTYPAHVLIIRHGEKPPDMVDAGLTAQGKERADKLHLLFEKSDDRSDPFPTPDFIFAASDTKASDRPVNTVKPLAKSLKVKLNDKYEKEQEAKLAEEVLTNPKYEGKTVLICWKHHLIPELAKAFGAKHAPKDWADEVFDRVWQIDYDAKGKATFRNLPQALLKGDAKE